MLFRYAGRRVGCVGQWPHCWDSAGFSGWLTVVGRRVFTRWRRERRERNVETRAFFDITGATATVTASYNAGILDFADYVNLNGGIRGYRVHMPFAEIITTAQRHWIYTINGKPNPGGRTWSAFRETEPMPR